MMGPCRIAFTSVLLAGFLGWTGAAPAQQGTVSRANQETFRNLLVSASEAMQREQLVESERLFNEALRMQPQSKDARFGMGALFIKQGRYAEAIRLLERLMEEFPNEFPVLNNLAWLYATAGDPAIRDGGRAVELAQEALLLQPNNFHVWNTLSEGHYVSGDYDRAVRAAQEAVRLAREARIDRNRINEYLEQVEKCRRAAEAMKILE